MIALSAPLRCDIPWVERFIIVMRGRIRIQDGLEHVYVCIVAVEQPLQRFLLELLMLLLLLLLLLLLRREELVKDLLHVSLALDHDVPLDELPVEDLLLLLLLVLIHCVFLAIFPVWTGTVFLTLLMRTITSSFNAFGAHHLLSQVMIFRFCRRDYTFQVV